MSGLFYIGYKTIFRKIDFLTRQAVEVNASSLRNGIGLDTNRG